MGKILIVNTGPTEYERYGPYPLVDRSGLDEPTAVWACAARDRLQEYRVSVVYFLPVPAGAETAEVISGRFSVSAQLLPGFEDSSLMAWKGLSPEEAVQMDCSVDQRAARVSTAAFPFGADLALMRQKMGAALDLIAEKHKSETIAIVSHRALTVLATLHFLHMSDRHFGQIAQESGAVNLFEVRANGPSALYINDTCHLKGLL